MKKITLLFVLFAFAKNYGQITFEKGYFINNQNQKTECLIKNQDWGTIPTKIEYKHTETSSVESIDFSEMASFQVYDTPHYYKKRNIQIDKNPGNNFTPTLQTTILKVLLEGNATLYKDNNRLYFYQIGEGEIKQLIYGQYEEEDKIKTNKMFQIELYNNLKCDDVTVKDIRKVDYKEKSLFGFFQKYNECANADYVDLTKNQTKTKFNVKVLGGLHINTSNKFNIDFTMNRRENERTLSSKSSSKSLNIALGFELEALLPFNKNKWAIFLSPTYQTYKDNHTKSHYDVLGGNYWFESPSGGVGEVFLSYDLQVKADYSYSFVELPIGIRHYWELDETSKLFVDGSYGFVLQLKKPVENVEFEQYRPYPPLYPLSLDMSTPLISSTIKMGFGYTYKDYSVALNYYFLKQLSNSNVNSFSIIASYKLF